MKNLELFWQLQSLEAKKADLQKQGKKVPGGAQLKLLKGEIEVIQNEARELNREINDLKKVLVNAENKLTDLRGKHSKASNELYNGNHASRELEASQKNLLVIKQKIESEEDNILGLMEKLEELNSRMRGKIKILDEKKDLFRTTNKAYSQKKEKIVSGLEETEKQITSILDKIDKDQLDQFNKFRQRFPDQCGIALLENATCSGCHITLSFEQIKQAKTNHTQLLCDNCGRLLLIK